MQSIYQRALGADFDRLQPELQAYFSLHAGAGKAGVGTGTFDVAGCPAWFIRQLFRLATSENSFFPEYGTDVRFQIVNYPHADPFGRASLTARRVLHFPGVDRVFEDTTSEENGQLLDYVGAHRLTLTDLTCSVTPTGRMRMVSNRTRVFAGPVRLPVPDVVGAQAYMEQWWDEQAGQFRIQTKVIHRQLGTLLVYAGSFDYWLVDFDGVLPVSAEPRRWEKRS
ncbi:DUF4166 domain-containing protein [Arthrobacter sp. H20]|uniref:DUF4166 domain-containing protein n=1 Tax=Arthrobacter sp. H20 TaxID=1267981 RepID=UPI00047B7E89|nr:DUF4166 domain-containing protein [Arthrobacter sp. H20]